MFTRFDVSILFDFLAVKYLMYIKVLKFFPEYYHALYDW